VPSPAAQKLADAAAPEPELEPRLMILSLGRAGCNPVPGGR
jgi:hypothetical protein